MQQADLQQTQQQQQQQQQVQQQQQNGNLSSNAGGGGGAGDNVVPATSGNIQSQSNDNAFGVPGKRSQISGGRFDFEDGGTYCGGWEDGKAHGHGVCTGPKHQGAYAGAWSYGFEVSGAYIWPSGSHYEGQWQNGRRHGLGVEQIGRQIYRGEWSKDGHKGRYGVRESTVSTAKYEGTWNLGYQDGYGCETYADGGKYQGQWQEGKRHGYGIRTSAPFGLASHHKRKNIHASLSSLRNNENGDPEKRQAERAEEIRGGFVLTSKSDKTLVRRNSLTEKSKKGFLSGLKMRKQRSTGDLEKRGTLTSGSIRSTMSTASWISTGSEQSNLTTKSALTESNASFTMEDEQLDPTVVETYMGEWKKDKRCGYGVAERSDGVKYEGEWYNNKKHGYGVTTFRDNTIEEGKYKNNVLITSQKKKHLFLARSRKFRERITAALNSAQRALKMAMQRSDIAISRTATAAAKAQNADIAAEQARIDCEMAVTMAREFAPDFKPSVLERFDKIKFRERYKSAPPTNYISPTGGNPMEAMYGPGPGGGGIGVGGGGGGGQRPNRSQTPAKMQDSEYPVPSSMYSQQLPVTPQTDLSSLVNQPQQGLSSISAVNQMYHQQQQQRQQQMQQNNPQMNPAYQYQQQQPPGPHLSPTNVASNFGAGVGMGMSMGAGAGAGVGIGASNAMGMAQNQNFSPTNVNSTGGSPLLNKQQRDITMFRDVEASHTASNINLQYQQQQQLQQQQQQQLYQQNLFQQQQQQQMGMGASPSHNASQIRRASQAQLQQQLQQQPTMDAANRAGKPPMLGQINQQSSIDYFDHYKRPPSRDSSIDRYARAASRLSGGVGAGSSTAVAGVGAGTATGNTTGTGSGTGLPAGLGGGYGSRQASVDRSGANPLNSGDADVRPRSGSVFRSGTPGPTPNTTPTTGNGSIPTGTGRMSRAATPNLQNRAPSSTREPMYSSANQPFEDVLLRQRTLGQDIIPSPLQPKRTESLYLPPKPVTPKAGIGAGGGGGGGGGNKKMKSVPINVTLQRKKSLPDFQELPRATEAMSREEVSALGSARREAVRRQIETNERLKANPLLYLVSPQVKDWFSRQQLVLLVLFVNILLALLFVKMLT